ncbi:hypothetical protein BDZ89DRAFT_1137188 [Hymenopellis radicata]|nr:hypothetical protein BDZ89DRAFT_1137188 [Hymenopellis radicata]
MSFVCSNNNAVVPRRCQTTMATAVARRMKALETGASSQGPAAGRLDYREGQRNVHQATTISNGQVTVLQQPTSAPAIPLVYQAKNTFCAK